MSGQSSYKFRKKRANHSAPVIGDSLYLWGGFQPGLQVHDSPQKRKVTSTVETFSFSSARWSSHLTRGTPPLGIIAYCCTTFRSNIYYYAGACGHDNCYHNSLNVLNTLTMSWTQLHPNDESMMKKAYGGMLSLELDGTDYLFMVGGYGTYTIPAVKHPQFQYDQVKDRLVRGRVRTNEQLLYNLSNGEFTVPSIPLPESVTGRFDHSLTAVTMSPNCVWLVIVGGCDKATIEYVGGVEELMHTFITDTNRLTMIIELVYIEAGQWIVQSVLDGNDLTSKKYQEKYSSYSKTRTWWMDQLIEYPTEKEMNLQRYIQSLHQELQVAHQNKVSLQEALTEANKQGSKVDGSQLVIMNEKLEEVLQEKQIITEDNEKLRATVAYNEVYITEIEEEKKQVEEEKRKVEEQYLIDKQITKELKAKVAVNDVYITELEEENEKVEKKYHKERQLTKELKSKVADNEMYTAKLMKEKSESKETSTKEVQFDYMIPSMDNLECLSDVQVAEKKLFLIQGDKPQLMNWEKYGVRIGVQKGSLLSSETVEAAVVALVGGQFEFPPNTVLVSAVYAVSLSKPLLKRLKLEIQHCVDLTGRPDLAQYLKFAIAPVSTPSLPYLFKFAEGGEFSSNGGYGFIERKDFCLVCILGLLIVSMTGGGGGGGGQQQQGTGSQGAGVVPAQGGNAPVPQQQPVVNPQTQGEQSQEGQREQEGDALTVLAQQQQPGPGASEQTNGQQGEEVQEERKHQHGAQSHKRNKSQSQDGQQEERDLLGEGGYQKGGERESQEQPEPLELQQEKGGQEEDPVHVETTKGKENKEHFDENVTSPISEVVNKPTTESKDEAQSNGVKEAVTYAGLVYYEEDGIEYLVTFTAAKKLDALIHYIEQKHSEAKIGPDISFNFKFPYDYVELNFDAPQKKPFTGWTLTPHTDPCRLYQEAIDKFGDKEHSRPSCCLISVYGSPDAVPFLNYFIPLKGVARPVSLNIHRARRNFTVPVPPSTNSTTSSSSSNVVHEPTALSTGGTIAPSSSGSDETIPVPAKRRREGGFDIKAAKQKIKQTNSLRGDWLAISNSFYMNYSPANTTLNIVYPTCMVIPYFKGFNRILMHS
uniref:Uncharacterized protein n=1 Tax=Amphimedon queenslandica TaxID=400682 RepID=A0A1X7THU4_AMPQE